MAGCRLKSQRNGREEDRWAKIEGQGLRIEHRGLFTISTLDPLL
jgi:hypothetical protein